jgi:adenylate cyclase
MLERSTALPAKFLAAIAAGVAVIFGALTFVPLWSTIELKGFDALTVITAPLRSSLPITIVGIDEASFAQVNKQWPWPRSLYGKLVDQLSKSGAMVIAFDMVFAEESTPEDVAVLGKAITRAGNVVLASDMGYQESKLIKLWMRVDPLPALKQAGATNGFANVEPDPDRALRTLPAGEDIFWRAIVARVNEKQPGLLSVAEPPERAMIRYVGPDHTFPYVSFYQALEADTMLPPDAFRDQIVLVGRDLKSNVDARMANGDDVFGTPFTMLTGWLTPGVEVHANILETVIKGDAVQRAPAWWDFALLATVLAAGALAMRRWRPAVSAIVAVAFMAAIAALDYALFTRMKIWLPAFAAMASVITLYVALGGVAFVSEIRRRSEMRRAFALYVSPEVVDHVMAHPESLALGGERRDVTMLFTDLAGFTTFTEQLGAEQVTRILNVHFSRATAIIKRHGGTVNRFIGDAIMAMWGAPLDDPQQAVHACLAACEMQEDLEKLRSEFKAEGLPEIRMRVGIHSCNAIIGNLGSSERFDYTAIGDGVNLAARLEGVNKLYGTGILASGETVGRVAGAVPMRIVDRVIVKGKSEPVDIYTPCSDLAVIEATARAIAAYRERRWEDSESIWRELQRKDSGDTLAAIYLERIKRCRTIAPGADWEGAVELEKL